MDNLTHSLVGAILGQMGLKRKTGLAMPTLIIAANIPDIDAVAVLLGGHQHLAIRRGITHGPIAMLLLPLLLWAAMLWFDRWQTKRGTRPEKRLPLDRKWLLILAYVGCLSHPLFDWFNSYGIRLLEPFSSQWFYGDTLFIIDLWIWAALIAGVWLSLRREKLGVDGWTKPPRYSFLVIFVYVGFNLNITDFAQFETRVAARSELGVRMDDIVANPVPIAFWRREMLWSARHGNGVEYGVGSYDIFRIPKFVAESSKFHSEGSRWEINAVRSVDSEFDAFLFWSRMPVIRELKAGKVGDGVAFDAWDMRFYNPLVRNRFHVTANIAEDDWNKD